MTTTQPTLRPADVRRLSTARNDLAKTIAKIDAVREAAEDRATADDPTYLAVQEQLAKAADAADEAFRRLRLAVEVASR